MIETIAITGLKYELDETTKKYVSKKIGRLDRYIPRQTRSFATAEVKLQQVDLAHNNKYEAEVILSLNDKTLTAKDTSMNMLAAVDIVEAKLVTQLKRYKENKVPHIGRRGVLSRFKRSYARESQ